MASIKAAYAASSSLTITLASLATSSSLIAGREATAVDNSTSLYLDYLIAGSFTAGTSPTAGAIEVHAVGMQDDSTWPDAFTGSDAARTITSADIKNAICRPVAGLTTDATSARVYPFGPVSVAGLFGGTCPRKFTLWVSHSMVVAMASGSIKITPCYATST